MKKLFALILALLMLCACAPEKEPEKIPEEKVETIWNIGAEKYTVDVPVKTRIEVGADGDVIIHTPSLSEGNQIVDLSGLSGCEYITRLTVNLNGESESLVLPSLPNLEYCEIFGKTPALIDASEAEGCATLSLSETLPDKIEIGKGPESLILGYGFDLSKISEAENVKNITLHGDCDLSKIADIGEVENVYIFGENNRISGLENLKSLKKLSLQAFSGDLSGIENLSMGTLALNSDIKQGTIDTLTKSETVTELHLNDELLTDVSVIDNMPNLKTVLMTVDGIQDEAVAFWHQETINEEMLALMNTNVDKKPLEKFLENGGEIYLIADAWR